MFVIIEGSHGHLRVHAATGFIIERVAECSDACECKGKGYADIVLFDPVDIRRETTHWSARTLDIVHVGYWDDQGRYEPATVIRLVEEDGEMQFDQVESFQLITYQPTSDTRPTRGSGKGPFTLACINAWKYDPDDSSVQEYCQWNEEPDGWCGYLRNADNTDCSNEIEFMTYEAARAWADRQGVEVREY